MLFYKPNVIPNVPFPEQQFGSVSLPVENLRLGMSVFVDETVVSEILFLMLCMRCNVELNTFSCFKSRFLSEFKCSCLLAPFKFHQQSSHEVSQCYLLGWGFGYFPCTHGFCVLIKMYCAVNAICCLYGVEFRVLCWSYSGEKFDTQHCCIG